MTYYRKSQRGCHPVPIFTKIPSSSSKTASLKMDSPQQQIHEAKHLGLQLPDQESSTIQFTGQSHHEVGAVGGTNSQGQCISSESDQDEGCGNAKGQMKAGFLLNNSDFMFNPSQVAHSYSMARVPYPYAEPCFGGLLTAYGPQAIMMGMAPARVPLPLDFTDYGPIYVNPKQYHGILRRRQSRAKLEAQNKLVKARKPYLHESRHRHALNRTRGTGGRFLSTKKGQNPDPTATSSNHYVSDTENISDFDSSQFGTHQHVGSITACSDITSVSNRNGKNAYQQPGHRFSGLSPHLGGAMQCNGSLVSGGTQHCASVVR
ncbi:nuclear transcription factor Y subunit A-3-like isoform X1 [Quercus lobata]|uniref:nuclear transcription factor Y subunit A-3-like isoform X1 n=1 Tax=Quercus lobata TaxID=97700 RepID=UPI0012475B08|nr:nuclear transcription factor Y subunit A-3-like isoform X1 [Quercus lobata]